MGLAGLSLLVVQLFHATQNSPRAFFLGDFQQLQVEKKCQQMREGCG